MTEQTPASSKLGEHLHGVRKRLGYTQVQLARISGVSAKYISSAENGFAPLRPLMIAQLACALGEDIRDCLELGKIEYRDEYAIHAREVVQDSSVKGTERLKESSHSVPAGNAARSPVGAKATSANRLADSPPTVRHSTVKSRPELREIIEDSVSEFFNTKVSAAEKVCQVLEDTGAYIDGLTHTLLASTVNRVAAVGACLLDYGANIDLMNLPRPVVASRESQDSVMSSLLLAPGAWSPSYVKERVKEVLGQAFLDDFFDKSSFNAVAKQVQENKYLDVVDMLRAPLKSLYNWPDDLPQTMLNAIMRGRGIDPEGLSPVEFEAEATRLDSVLGSLRFIDPSLGQEQLVVWLEGSEARLIPVGTWGAYRFQERPGGDVLPWTARGNIIVQRASAFAPERLAELEHLINTDAQERFFQDFFVRCPEFLLVFGEYEGLHSQIAVWGTRKRGVPDFLLEKMDSGFCDICELKRANVELVRRQRNRERFRDQVREAIAQLKKYRDWLEDERHRIDFSERTFLHAYKPQAILVIGRNHSFLDETERITLQADEMPPWARLVTYDDIIARARQWRMFSSG